MKSPYVRFIDFLRSEDRVDPFDLSFEYERVYQKYQELGVKDPVLLDFIRFCYAVNKDALDLIFKDRNISSISKEQFITILFKKANEFHDKFSILIQKALQRETSIDVEKMQFLRLEEDGENIDFSFMAEIGPDIVAQVLRWLEQFEDNGIKFSLENRLEKPESSSINKTWFFANVILNLKTSVYEFILNQDGIIERDTTGNFRLVSTNNHRLLRTCGEVRWHNHIQEAHLYLQDVLKTSRQVELLINISDGILSLKPKKVTEQTDKSYSVPSLLVYHFFLMNKKLEYFDGLTVVDLTRVLAVLDDCVSELFRSGSNKAFGTYYKILRQEVLDIITATSGKDIAIAERILASMLRTPSAPYLWRGPFYEFGDYLYFASITITAPNYNLYIERWLDVAGIGLEDREKLFTAAIRKEIEQKTFSYQLNVISFTSVGLNDSFFEDNVLLKTKTQYVLLQTALFPFPIEPEENFKATQLIEKSIQKLKAKLSLVEGYFYRNKLSVTVIPILITNYTNFTGIVSQGIPVADYTVFNNYFSSGSFKKSRLIQSDGRLRSTSGAEFQYYKDEDEFCNKIFTFFQRPTPVYKILERITVIDHCITPPILSHQVYIPKEELLSEEVVIGEDIEYLEELLKRSYIKDYNGKDETRLEDVITFQLQTIFVKMSGNTSEMLQYRSEIYTAITGAKEVGFFYLTAYIMNLLPKLAIMLDEPEPEKIEDINKTTLQIALNKFYDTKPEKPRLTEMEIDASITPDERKQLLSYAYIGVSGYSPGEHDKDDFDIYLLSVTILCALRKEFSIDEYVFTALSNLVDHLNNNQRTQDARDVCEEVLTFYAKDQKHAHAWTILFKCYSNQRNHFDAAIYGCLLFESLSVFPKIPYYLTVPALHNLLIFLRNFHYYDYGKQVYEGVTKFPLKPYDEQRMASAYYSMALHNPQLFDTSFTIHLVEYLNKSSQSIADFGRHGIIPWLSILYNIKRLQLYYNYELDARIDRHIAFFEGRIEAKQIDYLQTAILGKEENLKNKFIESLNHFHHSRNVTDFTAEINLLSVVAENLMRISIAGDDIDGIILCGQVLNDQTFSFIEKDIVQSTERPLYATEPTVELEKWNDYGLKVLEQLKLDPDQTLLWIFHLAEQAYCLEINFEKKFLLHPIENWDNKKADRWIDGLSQFFFNPKSENHVDIVQQELHYVRELERTRFAKLPIERKLNEVLIMSAIDMSEFPHNLYQLNGDFIAASCPVTNILSFESFLANSVRIVVPSKFSSSSWIPIEDQEGTINWGHDLLKPVLESINSKLFTKRYPDIRITTDINIFLAHGETGDFGFRSVYSNKATGGILENKEFVFGTGTVAILFICNSGNVAEAIFANNIVSFAGDLLKRGYKSVIAPFWKLDVTITPIWLTEFMASFTSGYSVSQAVYMANKEIGKYQSSVSNAFYAPEGQLAMHLYGNPNVYLAV